MMAKEFDEEAFAGTRPVTADELDIAGLNEFLAELTGEQQNVIKAERFRGGQSNPTFKLSTSGGYYVLRRKPPGIAVKSGHAIDREYRIMKALSATKVPVPEVFAYCEDAGVIGSEFYLMAFSEGRIFWDPLMPQLEANRRARIYADCCQVLADFHSLDPCSIGLDDFGRQGGYLERQFARWTDQYVTQYEAPSEDMRYLIDWLKANLGAFSDETTLVHGDFRLDNIIYHPVEDRAVAIIDWELATLGHPLFDLANQCMQWRLPVSVFGGMGDVDREPLGIPSEERYIAAYCGTTGRANVPNWEYYIAFSMYRFAAVLYGVAMRVKTGAASSHIASKMAGKAPLVAEQAVELVRCLK